MKVLAYKPVLLDLEEKKIRSYTNPDWVWPLDRILTASPCPMGHTTVAEDCTCGIQVTVSGKFLMEFAQATSVGPIDGAHVPALSLVQVMGGLVLDDAGNGRADRIFMWGVLLPRWMSKRLFYTLITAINITQDVRLEAFVSIPSIRTRLVDAWKEYKKEGQR